VYAYIVLHREFKKQDTKFLSHLRQVLIDLTLTLTLTLVLTLTLTLGLGIYL